jgi:hypothetical protein
MYAFRKQAAAAFAFATLAMIGVDAAAATIKVTCEARGTTRSKVSVDGKDLLAGTYTTQILSGGGNMATSSPVAAVAGQIETDYDSRPADIRAGATAITPTFISGGTVTGKIVDSSGSTVISDKVHCRMRSN